MVVSYRVLIVTNKSPACQLAFFAVIFFFSVDASGTFPSGPIRVREASTCGPPLNSIWRLLSQSVPHVLGSRVLIGCLLCIFPANQKCQLEHVCFF